MSDSAGAATAADHIRAEGLYLVDPAPEVLSSLDALITGEDRNERK